MDGGTVQGGRGEKGRRDEGKKLSVFGCFLAARGVSSSVGVEGKGAELV